MSLLYLFYRWGKWRFCEVSPSSQSLFVHFAPHSWPRDRVLLGLTSPSSQLTLFLSYLLTCTYSLHTSFWLTEGTLMCCHSSPVCAPYKAITKGPAPSRVRLLTSPHEWLFGEQVDSLGNSTEAKEHLWVTRASLVHLLTALQLLWFSRLHAHRLICEDRGPAGLAWPAQVHCRQHPGRLALGNGGFIGRSSILDL